MVKKLIGQYKIEEAIKFLLKSSNNDNQVILLSSRLIKLKRQKKLGLLSHSETILEQNKICNALLEFSSNFSKDTNDIELKVENSSIHDYDLVMSYCKRYIDRNKLLHLEADKLLTLINKYKKAKELNQTYDKTKRLFQLIDDKITCLKIQVKEYEKDQIEELVTYINKQLEDLTLESIKNCYKRLVGKGIKSDEIELMLEFETADSQSLINAKSIILDLVSKT